MNWLSKKIRDNVEARACEHFRETKRRIWAHPVSLDFKSPNCEACLVWCWNHSGYRVVEAIKIENEVPSLHYLVCKESVYYDLIFSRIAEHTEYYVLGTIPDGFYDNLREVAHKSRLSLLNEVVKWYEWPFVLGEDVL